MKPYRLIIDLVDPMYNETPHRRVETVIETDTPWRISALEVVAAVRADDLRTIQKREPDIEDVAAHYAVLASIPDVVAADFGTFGFIFTVSDLTTDMIAGCARWEEVK